jgi:hypothetical protein
MIALGVLAYDDPSPMTRAGTHALVEAFYSMKRAGVGRMALEVGAGGAPGGAGTTTPTLLGPTKSKSSHARKKQKGF